MVKPRLTGTGLKLFRGLAVPEGFEPSTGRLEGGCSIQLSYETVPPFWTKAPPQARLTVMNTLLGSS